MQHRFAVCINICVLILFGCIFYAKVTHTQAGLKHVLSLFYAKYCSCAASFCYALSKVFPISWLNIFLNFGCITAIHAWVTRQNKSVVLRSREYNIETVREFIMNLLLLVCENIMLSADTFHFKKILCVCGRAFTILSANLFAWVCVLRVMSTWDCTNE